MRFLYKCRIIVFKDSYSLNCTPLNPSPSSKNKSLVFRGSEEGFKLFLRRIKAKDTQTDPPSSKNRTYQQMIDQAKDGANPYIYVWSNYLPAEGAIREGFLDTEKTAKEWLKEKLCSSN